MTVNKIGTLAYVLLITEAYQKISSKEDSVAALLAMPESGKIDLALDRSKQSALRKIDFS